MLPNIGNSYPLVDSKTGTLYSATVDGHLLISADDGTTWTDTALPRSCFTSNPSNVLVVNAVAPQKLLAASNVCYGVFLTTNGDIDWTLHPVAATGQMPQLLVFAPQSELMTYAIVPAGLYRSDDGGKTWAEDVDGSPPGTIQSLSFTLTSPPTLYAVAGGAVFRKR